MPLFEVDASRPLLVQSGQTAGSVEPGLRTTAHRVVDSHIDGLLGEQIFPVAQGSGPDEPHLLALDATGSPVVVELVANLDKAALTRALDHAGWAGRLTRGELASRYHGGHSAFQRDIATFYDSVPITRSQPGRSSARLIVICQEAGEDILNAVDFLRQPTMPVEVLKMGVMHGQDGRRFVDVSPLVIHPASDSTSPRLSGPGRPGGENAASAASGSRTEAEPESFVEGVKVGLALTGKSPAVAVPAGGDGETGAPVPAPHPRDAVGDTAEQPPLRRGRAARRAEAAGGVPGPSSLSVPQVPTSKQSPPTPVPAPATGHGPVPPPPSTGHAPVPPAPATGHAPVPPPPSGDGPQVPRRRSRSDRFRESGTTSDPAPRRRPASADDLDLAGLARRTTSAASPDTPSALDLPVPGAGSRNTDPLDSWTPWSETSERDWKPSTPGGWTDASDDLPRLQVPPLEAPSYTPPPERRMYEAAADEDEVDEDLVALAKMFGRPTYLEWSRPRRQQHFEALLHTDGVIELPDGSRYQHPDHAASAACGAPTDDGWNVWRVVPDGVTLLEAYRSRFA
ncbi:hypothetical protein Q6350_12610 [Isoptericola sp. b515]|uniref:restriction system modified-DNA reader domain-containing protein n=1 Tax=Isoptericola sp. b515 TaxID=3064652 RepID=UPI0027133D5B|nr:hypothetical protein [Isoptericola sp. b515]MDO8149271.1 hypothetical protein [Isoptericola sp. b515]